MFSKNEHVQYIQYTAIRNIRTFAPDSLLLETVQVYYIPVHSRLSSVPSCYFSAPTFKLINFNGKPTYTSWSVRFVRFVVWGTGTGTGTALGYGYVSSRPVPFLHIIPNRLERKIIENITWEVICRKLSSDPYLYIL